MTDERDPIELDADAEELEVIDGLPVLAADEDATMEARPADAGALSVVGSRQVAALAATGFMAGAATVAMVHRRRNRSLAKRLSAGRSKRTALGEVVTSSSFLVDVHLIRRD